MAIERMYRQAAEVNRDFGPIASLPPCFDYGVGGVWQGMSRHRFREFTNFSTAQERNRRVAEQLLSELDALLLSYCIKGCPQPCVNEERDVAGVPVTPLFEQFYYHFQGQIVVIVVSRKPTCPDGQGRIDAHNKYVITEDAFLARRDSLAARQKWELKRALLRKMKLPHILAGPRPMLVEEQEDISALTIADQQCGAVREKVLNLDWPGFRTLSPAASNASSSDGHSSQGEESESEALVSEAAARYVPPYRREGNTSPCRTGRGCYDKGCITPGQFSDW